MSFNLFHSLSLLFKVFSAAPAEAAPRSKLKVDKDILEHLYQDASNHVVDTLKQNPDGLTMPDLSKKTGISTLPLESILSRTCSRSETFFNSKSYTYNAMDPQKFENSVLDSIVHESYLKSGQDVTILELSVNNTLTPQEPILEACQHLAEQGKITLEFGEHYVACSPDPSLLENYKQEKEQQNAKEEELLARLTEDIKNYITENPGIGAKAMEDVINTRYHDSEISTAYKAFSKLFKTFSLSGDRDSESGVLLFIDDTAKEQYFSEKEKEQEMDAETLAWITELDVNNQELSFENIDEIRSDNGWNTEDFLNSLSRLEEANKIVYDGDEHYKFVETPETQQYKTIYNALKDSISTTPGQTYDQLLAPYVGHPTQSLAEKAFDKLLFSDFTEIRQNTQGGYFPNLNVMTQLSQNVEESVIANVSQNFQKLIEEKPGLTAMNILATEPKYSEAAKYALGSLDGNVLISEGRYFANQEAQQTFETLCEELKTTIEENPNIDLDTLADDYKKDKTKTAMLETALEVLVDRDDIYYNESTNYYSSSPRAEEEYFEQRKEEEMNDLEVEIINQLTKHYLNNETVTLEELQDSVLAVGDCWDYEDFDSCIEYLEEEKQIIRTSESDDSYTLPDTKKNLSNKVFKFVEKSDYNGIDMETLKEEIPTANTSALQQALNRLSSEGKIYDSAGLYKKTNSEWLDSDILDEIKDYGACTTAELAEYFKTTEEIITVSCDRLQQSQEIRKDSNGKFRSFEMTETEGKTLDFIKSKIGVGESISLDTVLHDFYLPNKDTLPLGYGATSFEDCILRLDHMDEVKFDGKNITLLNSAENAQSLPDTQENSLPNKDTLVVFQPHDKASPPIQVFLNSISEDKSIANIRSDGKTIPVHLDKGELHSSSRSVEQEQKPKRSSGGGKSQSKSNSHGR